MIYITFFCYKPLNTLLIDTNTFRKIAGMAQLWTLLVAVVGILTYFYLNQKKSTNEKQYTVLNETYDYIIGTST